MKSFFLFFFITKYKKGQSPRERDKIKNQIDYSKA
jgi:hypothetical protein